MQYTSLDRILSKVYRDLGLEDISETDVIEWTGEALEGIGVVTMLEESVAFVEVKNYQAEIPNGLVQLIQVARDNEYDKKIRLNACNILFDKTNEEIIKNPPKEINDEDYVLDSSGNKICGSDLLKHTQFDIRQYANIWGSSTIYKSRFTPVRLSNHTFFGSLVCPEAEDLYHSCTDEYTLSMNKLKFSFEEGLVAVAYYRRPLDEDTGYPLVPDNYSVIQAITSYITYKYMSRLWYLGREGYADKVQKSESDWQWYCKQASNDLMMVKGIDAHENLKNILHGMIPQRNLYYGFFGKLGHQQVNTFKTRSSTKSFRGI